MSVDSLIYKMEEKINHLRCEIEKKNKDIQDLLLEIYSSTSGAILLLRYPIYNLCNRISSSSLKKHNDNMTIWEDLRLQKANLANKKQALSADLRMLNDLKLKSNTTTIMKKSISIVNKLNDADHNSINQLNLFSNFNKGINNNNQNITLSF